jgi:hypothetical protein
MVPPRGVVAVAQNPFLSIPPIGEGAYERLRASIDPDWIDAALAATGTATLRKRRLPAEQVIWLVLGMALYRDRPIDELVEKLDLVMPGSGTKSMAKSAVAQARARLGDQPLKWLFERCSEHWGHDSARRHAWRGLALYGVDGTTLRVPDSPENRAHFGGQSAGPGREMSGYPLVRMVTMMALRSHLLVGASFGPYASELRYAEDLWSKTPDDSLMLVDRGFFTANILISLATSGQNRHWMTRAKAQTKYVVLKSLGKGDDLVEVKVSGEARSKNPELPQRWQMRAVKYRIAGFPPQILLTSLVDPQRYPADELRALYHERWELELGYDEVKTHLLERHEAIRSRTPKGVMQELWAIGLAYNLVRLEMERIAEQANVAPNRISFVMSLRLIQDEWAWSANTRAPGAIPKHLRRLREEVLRFVLPPRRRLRSFPRAVKIKMSSYERKRPAVPKGSSPK